MWSVECGEVVVVESSSVGASSEWRGRVVLLASILAVIVESTGGRDGVAVLVAVVVCVP